MLKYYRFLLLGLVLMLGNCKCGKLAPQGGEKAREEEVDSNAGDDQEHIEEKVDPNFALERQEDSLNEVYVNETVQLVLKETALSKKNGKIKCKIVSLYATNGELLIDNKEGGDEATKLLAEGDELIIEKGSFPLIFKPIGKIGQANISITLETEDKKKATVRLNLFLNPASTIYLATPKEIHTGEEEKITLNITSRDPHEKFTIQSIKPEYGEVELMYASGEYVQLGDKLKPGVHQFTYKIHRRDHVEPVVTLDGYTTYKGWEICRHSHESNLEISLTDSKGNEYQPRREYNIFDLSFELKLKIIHWNTFTIPSFLGVGGGSYYEPLYNKGYIKFEFEIKERIGDGLLFPSISLENQRDPIYGKERYKIISCKASDGLPVSLVDFDEKSVIGNIIGERMPDFLFKLDEMRLETDSQVIIEIEGPRGIIKELVINVLDGDKDDLLDRKVAFSCKKLLEELENVKLVEQIQKDYSFKLVWKDIGLNQEIEDILRKEKHAEELEKIGRGTRYVKKVWGTRYVQEAWEAGKKAAFILDQVEKMKDEVKKVPGLKNALSDYTLQDLERLILAVQKLEKNIEEINKVYGFNL